MNIYAVYFVPRGALATWPLTSDTLFGAVCWGIRTLGLMDDQQLSEWLEGQRQNPHFTFSHAFPAWLQDGQIIRLYPRPANFHPNFDDFETLAEEWQKVKGCSLKAAKVKVAEIGKVFKKLSYVSESILTHIIAGQMKPIDGMRCALFEKGLYRSRAKALCTTEEAANLPERLLESEAMQHNQVDRLAGTTVEGMLFYRDETYFAPGAGLWAVLKAEPTEVDKYIQPALRYLADTGLGADRTTGKGHFEIHLKDFAFPFQTNAPVAMMTLSHYLPQTDELNLQAEPLAYVLKTLRPRREQKFPRPLAADQTSPPIYKRAMYVFEPGSVFAIQIRKEIYGQLVRLTPENEEPVYQSGAAIMVMM